MDRNSIDKIAQNEEDKRLLAKLWDKIQNGIRKNIPSSTGFLSPRELQLARLLFGNTENLHIFGGYEDAERKMLCYLPDYLEEDYLLSDDSPIACLQADFYTENSLTHRDFLGALMGMGITRESVGDILVAKGTCQFFVTGQMVSFLLQNMECAGRVKLRLQQISLTSVTPPTPNLIPVKDTVSSLRLDCIVSAGFRISRGQASDAIEAGRVAIDGLPCDKPDRTVSEGCKISCRGLGKIRLTTVGHTTKKQRISVVIHRYE